MTTSSRFWADWTTLDFERLRASGLAARTIAVLPVAATEQHGPHLPLSVDTVLVDGIITASLDQLPADVPVLFLPTQAVGLSPEHARFPGTLTLKNETILRLWTDIAESVAAAGIRKLVLFNSHGGHVGVMDLVARDLRARLDMLVYSVSWFNLPLADAQGRNVHALFSAEEHRFGIHGGDIETSMMLALDPARVDMAQARHFESRAQARAGAFEILGNGKSAKLGWQTQDYNPAGAVGHAANATAEKGQALVDAAGNALARLLVEVDRLPANTLLDRPALG
ncbi:creatininase family protein [Rhodoferax sp.]|uniref:creatininase family protein n=1 Tax=Rhodoferax sp. TaxID=50421 RepID=UPI0027249A98|nr:creatininase family protein [Rhodoferax sp.]MDO9143010.1 creatininase family protein [Rhodoferax sp.]MDP3191197.1 creatininase family protein [Rhodoferax sp.]MDP3336526.1 creatininase family protein [Rhodoferax sp.]MDP3865381.1 creatininase family protein [Rhodoferax sp.]